MRKRTVRGAAGALAQMCIRDRPNTIHLLEAGGLRVAHMGDAGCMPSPEILERLQELDAVMLPVGGYYTVGPEEAQAIVEAIHPRVVIPMHYRSDRFGFDVLAPVEKFLDLNAGHWMRYDTDTLEIHGGMSHHVAVLTYGCLLYTSRCV